jgi:two-component system cell cycle sensor histidine kinase/response regulator CckA
MKDLPEPKKHSGGNSHFRFLCLEDNENDKVLLEDCLRTNGLSFDLVHARTKQEFETALRGGAFDLVISDYTIPAYSGLAALGESLEVHPDTPFLIVSGTIGEERAVESLKSGAADYVLKEHLNRLGPAVRRALREAVDRRGRKQAELSLKESEARFRQLAENIGDVLCLMDARTNEILYASPAYEKIWGRSVEELYNHPENWVEAIHPEDRDRIRQLLADKQISSHHDYTYRIVHSDESTRWIRDQAFPIRNEAGEVYRMVRVAEDVTANKLLEGQLRHAQKMEAVGQLAGGIAHDFNNLLCVIRGNVDLVLSDDAALPMETRECLNQIAAASERAANLTRQLLAFGRKQVIQLQTVKLNELVANLMKMFDRVIQENIQVRCDYDPQEPHVLADPSMLEQVLLNLVLNARDAMPNGGTLSISTEQVRFNAEQARTNAEATEGNFVCLKISDCGIGIAPEHLAHIFEPFFTTKGINKGTGLGLATVYGIVKQHRGWIDVSSSPGDGATFKVFLPAVSTPGLETFEPDSRLNLRGGTETIFVVEDDAGVRSMTRRTLETFGYQVLEASSATQAIEIAGGNFGRADLLLTDLVMPGQISASDLAKQLRAIYPSMKVIFMSGYSQDIAKCDTDFIRKSSAGFLQKPHSLMTLLHTVRQCLDAA